MMTSSNGNIFRVTGPLPGNSPVTGEFPSQRSVTRSFDVFFYLCPNKRLNEQSGGWCFETPSRQLWRHCNTENGHFGNFRCNLWRNFHQTDDISVSLSVPWWRALINICCIMAHSNDVYSHAMGSSFRRNSILGIQMATTRLLMLCPLLEFN